MPIRAVAGPRALERVPALIACALQAEADLLAAQPLMDGLRVVATGLGPERTRRALGRILPELSPPLLVFTGAAGGLDPSLPLGAVVIPEKWRLEGGDLYPAHPPTVELLRSLGWPVEGIGWTATVAVADWERKQALFKQSRARVCDMEAAAALETANRLRVPAIALKIVTDPASPGSPPFTVDAFRRILPQVIPSLARHLARLLADLAGGTQ